MNNAQKHVRCFGLFCSTLAGFFLFAGSANAQTFLSNENILTERHPAPLMTEEDPATASEFPLEDGNTLSLTRNAYEGIRIWRFTVGEAYWWVTDKGIIWGAGVADDLPHASTDEEAYALYFTL